MPKRSPICPACQSITSKVHEDRIQKMNQYLQRFGNQVEIVVMDMNQ
ncbi:hypothetical protein [Kurthia sibirica]|nr:hypothetical protein [Kurthia sibirica]